MPLDYETLRVIWWVLLGVLLIGFAIMDGFDLGVAMWLPWIARTDSERRILINCIGPTWEGNQVWLILSGGAIFAAWPNLYALSFSGFYLAMLLTLLSLILRPVGFKYRSKINAPLWRTCWDYALFIGGLVPALIFGVAVGNVLQGVPFHYDDHLRSFYTGSFIELLNPFALLTGILSITMLAMHGAFFLSIKTESTLKISSQRAARVMAGISLLLFVGGGLWLYYGAVPGFSLSQVVSHDGPSNPLHKMVTMAPMAWFNNYLEFPITRLVPILGIVGLCSAFFFNKRPYFGFLSSAFSLTGIIATVGVSMFPFILPSSTHPNHSLLVWDSSSSQLTLFIMLLATAIFLPIILAYTAWVYRVLRGPVTQKSIESEHSAY